MSTMGQRWRNSSPVFRILLLLLIILLLLLCLWAFLQYAWPIIRPAAGPTPAPVTSAPVVQATTPTQVAPATDTPVATLTQTPVVAVSAAATGTVTITPTPLKTVGPTTAITPTQTVTPVVEIRNVLRNGNFEEGFQTNALGKYWKGFNNGSADFSFHIDDWDLVVVEGDYTQLIEIKDAILPDRYLGIYQTAPVIPGEVYTFSIRGLVRTNTGDVEKTSYGYRLQVGFDPSGGHDWEKVKGWVELPWDEQLRVQDSFRFDSYTTTLKAKNDQMTVFIRAWKKWADSGEGDYDVDDIQLVGPAYAIPPTPAFPVTGEGPATLWDNVRVWATIALLLILVAGAIWQLRRQTN